VKHRSACAAHGTHSPTRPLAAISSALQVRLSTTTAIRGGVNSTGIDHAAAIRLRRARSRLVTSTVGP
jgi:hypothetical protein